MSLAQGNNTPTRPRIEPGSSDPESDALTTRPVRPPDDSLTSLMTIMRTEQLTECSEPLQKLRVRWAIKIYLSSQLLVLMSFLGQSTFMYMYVLIDMFSVYHACLWV